MGIVDKVKDTLWGAPDKGIHNDTYPDPADLTVDNAYKTRWIWYHTILGIELLVIIILLTAILVAISIK